MGYSDLYDQLTDGDSLEVVAGAPLSQNKNLGAAIQQIVGNPTFKAEISLNFAVKYYSQATVGTPVEVAAAGLQASQKGKLPLYLFGYNDWRGGYKKAKGTVGVQGGWNLADSTIYVHGAQGTDPTIYPLPHAAGSVGYALGSVYNSLLDPGDIVLVIPQSGFVAAAAATTTIAEVIIKCPNVAYASLLSSLSSDTFVINMIRYTVDPNLLTQLQNQISIISQSIFGKAAIDTLDPNTFINSGTYNKNISDMPLNLIFNKYIGLAMQINYDSVSFSMVLTVQTINKLR